MEVTNLIQNIGKCRDLIQSKDKKKIVARLYLFEKVYLEVASHMHRYLSDPKHELDFTYSDLQELSDEIAHFIKRWPAKFSANKYIEAISKNEVITDKEVKELGVEILRETNLDSKLRECQKVLAYYAYVKYLWDMNHAAKKARAEQAFTVEITNAIRSFL